MGLSWHRNDNPRWSADLQMDLCISPQCIDVFLQISPGKSPVAPWWRRDKSAQAGCSLQVQYISSVAVVEEEKDVFG